MLYNNSSSYFRGKYGKRLQKICIDGGFTCPNRDGKCGTGGCIFCGERGAGEHTQDNLSIREQVLWHLERRGENEIFVAYFQSYTNTYAPIEILKERYDAATFDKRVIALAVGTRPDCIDEDVAGLLASYKERIDVWVELGLQTSRNDTGILINRGYDSEDYLRAVEILKRYQIEVITHMIVGLPGEDMSDAIATARFIGASGVNGIKIHSIYVSKGTLLAEMYNKKLYTPPTLEEYVRTVGEIIAILPKDMIIHRMTGDCPPELLIAPKWNGDKNAMIDGINKYLADNKLYQGAKA